MAAPLAVAKFPMLVPMDNPFDDDEYFVWDCYRECYDRVFTTLKGPCEYARAMARAIAIVSGDHEERVVRVPSVADFGGWSQALAKSLCMAYFFERYRREHPDVAVFMAAYTRLSRHAILTKVVIVRGKSILANVEGGVIATGEAIRVHGELPAAVFFSSTDRQIGCRVRSVGCVHRSRCKLDGHVAEKQTCDCDDVHAGVDPGRAASRCGTVGARGFGDRRCRKQSRARELFVSGNTHDGVVPAKTRLESRFALFGGVAYACFAGTFYEIKGEIDDLNRAISSLSVDGILNALAAEKERREDPPHPSLRS